MACVPSSEGWNDLYSTRFIIAAVVKAALATLQEDGMDPIWVFRCVKHCLEVEYNCVKSGSVVAGGIMCVSQVIFAFCTMQCHWTK